MKLIRDVLDKQVIDRARRPVGKVDGLLVVVGEGAPRVVALELGSRTLARRLGPRVARVVDALARWLHLPVCGVYRVPWGRIMHHGANEIRVDVVADETPASTSERWIREHVVARLPGGRR